MNIADELITHLITDKQLNEYGVLSAEWEREMIADWIAAQSKDDSLSLFHRAMMRSLSEQIREGAYRQTVGTK